MEPQEGRSVYGDWRTASVSEGGLLRSQFQWLLRPATPYEMIDDGVSLYREHFRPFVTLSAGIYLFPILLTILFLIPIILIEMRTTTPQAFPLSSLLECGSLLLILPYFIVVPPIQAMMTSYVAYRLLQGQPVSSLKELWLVVRPRIGQLIANQILAGMLLGAIYTAISIGVFVVYLAGALGIAALNLGGTVSLIALLIFLLFVAILALVLLALATIWFIILPQVILFETEVDALTAFSRAFSLVRQNFRHAFVSCLLFWAFQGVLYTSAYLLLILIVSVVGLLLYTYGVDLQTAFLRWSNTFGNAVDIVSYVVFIFVLPPTYLTSFFFYFDLRYRAEGLDIAQGLAQGARE